MVARNAFAQLNYSWFLLLGTIIGLFILFVSPVIGMGISVTGKTAILVPSGIALVSMSFTYLPTIRFFYLNVVRIFSLPVAGFLYQAMTVSSAINFVLKRREWRGSRRKKDKQNDSVKNNMSANNIF